MGLMYNWAQQARKRHLLILKVMKSVKDLEKASKEELKEASEAALKEAINQLNDFLNELKATELKEGEKEKK